MGVLIEFRVENDKMSKLVNHFSFYDTLTPTEKQNTRFCLLPCFTCTGLDFTKSGHTDLSLLKKVSKLKREFKTGHEHAEGSF